MTLPALTLALALALGAQGGAQSETTVTTQRPVDVDDDRAAVDALGPAPEDALLGVLGASLIHEGGPLAPTRPMIRGLAGARIGVDVGGLPLTDPGTGLWDAALLPWAAAGSVVVDSGPGALAPGGNVKLELLRAPGVKARVLAGSLATVRASLAAVGDGTLVAVDAGSTAGDFTFQPTSPVAQFDNDGIVDLALVRANNDHRRASVLARTGGSWGELDVDAVAVAAGHTGGVPGFSTAPTAGLRAEDALAGGRVSAAVPSAIGGRFVGSVDGRAARRATFGPTQARAAIESASGRAEVGVVGVAVAGGAVVVDVRSGVDHATLLGAAAPAFARSAADASVGARVTTGAVRWRGSVDGRVTNDVGRLLGGELRAEVGDAWRASAGVARRSRAPTLDELYAPRGLVLGNPALRPETLSDVELALAFVPGRIVDARIVSYAGLLDDAIVFLNKNASEIEPFNVGPGWRAGVDVSICVEPSSWLALDVTGALLASRLDITGEPLPLAPPFSSRIALRAGAADGPHVTGTVRSRGPAPSNGFGTLVSAPYALVDVAASLPVERNLRIGLAVENVLDARDARDANLLPLPGRLLFVTLELHR